MWASAPTMRIGRAYEFVLDIYFVQLPTLTSQALRASVPTPFGNEKEQAVWLALWLVFDQIARSTLLERRHLVQTYTWRGVPSTIALTRLTLGFHARLARL